MIDPSVQQAVTAVLSDLPGPSGGPALLLATGGTPPAIALLSTGDVFLDRDRLKAGVYASSSTVARLGGSFSVLVPLGTYAARIEAIEAHAVVGDNLAVIEGRVASIRPTVEPPWVLEMRFRPEPLDDFRVTPFINYWRGVRAWLSGRSAEPPLPPVIQ